MNASSKVCKLVRQHFLYNWCVRSECHRTLMVNKRGFSDSKDQESSNPDNDGAYFEKKFLRKDVQDLLYQISSPSPETVYRPRRKEKSVLPTYRLLLGDQLEKMKSMYDDTILKHKLRPPPVMGERKPVEKVLEQDERLANYDTKRHIFIDISYGVEPKNRHIVVREVDGTLRTANWEERDRMCNMFYPKYYREMRRPKMFEPEQLEVILGLGRFEYILERTFVQYEPDSADYIRITQRVFEHVNDKSLFPQLDSTRWFSSLVFYLIKTRNLDHLFSYLLSQPTLERCQYVVTLYRLLHPHSEYSLHVKHTSSAVDQLEQLDQLKVFAEYCCTEDTDHIINLINSKSRVLGRAEVTSSSAAA